MKIFFGLILCSSLLAQSVGAQSVTQPFVVSWDYTDSTQTGFRIERMPPGGTLGVIDSVGFDIRSYTDMVTGSPGDTFSWRVVAFNADQTSPPSAAATGSITVIETVSPPAPSVTTTVKNKNQCVITLSGTPPDSLGGWTVQFRNSGAPFGSVDSSEPFIVTGTLKAGSYNFWGSWSKVNQPTLQSAHVGARCP